MTYGTPNASVPHARKGSAVAVVPATGKAGADRQQTEDSLHGRSPATGLAQMGFVIELPLPPSVNSYVRRLGNASPGVRRWRLHCDSYLYEQSRFLRQRAVKGAFLCDITWPETRWIVGKGGEFDIDNRIKALLDYLQARDLIENDRLCKKLIIGWGATKIFGFGLTEREHGCRVEVLPRREVPNEAGTEMV